MKKLLLLFAILVAGVAQAQLDDYKVVVGLDLIHTGSEFDSNDYGFTVGFDLMEEDNIFVGPLVGISIPNGHDAPVSFLVGGEGNIDIIGNALQIGGRVVLENVFQDDDLIAVGPQLISELGQFRLRVGYLHLAHFQESAEFSDEALTFGVGFRF